MRENVEMKQATVHPVQQGEMDALLLGKIKELPHVEIDGRNWRGIGIAILVILFMSGIIASVIFLLNPGIGDFGKNIKDKFKLEEIIDGTFLPISFNGTWLSNNELLLLDGDGNLQIFTIHNSDFIHSKLLVHNSTLLQHSIQKFTLSFDRKFLLFLIDIKKIFRHSYLAKHKIYDIENDVVLSLNPLSNNDEIYLNYASWGRKRSQLIFVHQNNIYYKENPFAVAQLIVKNENNQVNNGIPDWVYEEEILSKNNAVWWSPDGLKLCYASFDDTAVDEVQYLLYDDISNASITKLKYPKSGRPNPRVKITVVYFNNGGFKEVIPPNSLKHTDYYFTSVSWMNDLDLAIIWLNRAQNHSIISICKEQNNYQCMNHVEQTNSFGWVEMYESPLFSDKHYFVRLPKDEGVFGHYKHIAMVSFENGDKTFITEGQYDVMQILSIGHNGSSTFLYYLSTLKGKAGERHVLRLNIDNLAAECLTCHLGDECLFNTATFSLDASYYVLECNGPAIPRIQLHKAYDDSLLMNLQMNDAIKHKLEKKLLPKINKLNINTGDYNISVMLYLPPSLQQDEQGKYPLLIQVYGGPGSQMVTEKFQINWGTYLATSKNIIYGMIDGRGSGGRGDKFLHELYHKLGTLEVDDQILGVKYLRDKLSYIKKEAIGIWGWSYGGYVSSMALVKDKNKVFSCGLSVAPVTSWLLYDSVYTERYMGLPRDNMNSYLEADLLNKAKEFKGKKYKLIHGTADDNVHFQQSLLLMRSLTNHNIIYETQIYPDQNHALSGVKLHLYKLMESFWEDCFKIYNPETSNLQRKRNLQRNRQ